MVCQDILLCIGEFMTFEEITRMKMVCKEWNEYLDELFMKRMFVRKDDFIMDIVRCSYPYENFGFDILKQTMNVIMYPMLSNNQPSLKQNSKSWKKLFFTSEMDDFLHSLFSPEKYKEICDTFQNNKWVMFYPNLHKPDIKTLHWNIRYFNDLAIPLDYSNHVLDEELYEYYIKIYKRFVTDFDNLKILSETIDVKIRGTCLETKMGYFSDKIVIRNYDIWC